jgi:hypothetical protein
VNVRKLATALGLVALLAVVVGFGAASASAANEKLVEGTVYDTSCAAACLPECPPPPHCGPVTQSAKGKVVCARRAKAMIVCPLYRTVVCVKATCPGPGAYPVYSGEGAVVKVRRRGSATVLATLPVVEGRFQIRLTPGEYVFRPFLGEEPCWSGARVRLKVTPKLHSPVPVPVAIDVSNRCVAHPGAAG